MKQTSDLVSDFVQQCLGFSDKTTKFQALQEVRYSLVACFVDENDQTRNNDETILMRQKWREFLDVQGCGSNNDEIYDPSSEPASNLMLRDSFIKCLVECCSQSIEREEGNENSSDIIESAFTCLTHLVRATCAEREKGSGQSKPISVVSPVFGPEFILTIAPSVIEALSLDKGSAAADGVLSGAASDLLVALLRPDRPRNEFSPSTIRDSILIPASSSGAPPGSVACVAEVLSSSLLTGIQIAVPASDSTSAEDEESSMRRETTALSKLQDMRDVFLNIASLCVLGINDDNGDSIHFCSQRVMNAIQKLHDIVPFAVESQLETLTGVNFSLILTKLSEDNKELPENNPDAPTSADDENDDAKADDQSSLPPLYSSIAKPPIALPSLKSLEQKLDSIAENIAETDPERWDVRMGALVDIECILAGGMAWMGPEARLLFIERLRKIPVHDQFVDLRSQITQQACRVIIALSYEFRDYVKDDQPLGMALSHFIESCIPSILRLSISGTRLMATQGMNCLLCLAALAGRGGYPRIIAGFCEDVTAKKSHKNRKRGSVMALTAALRVWDPNCFSKHADKIAAAVKEAATDRDPGVREDGRKLYWALHACGKLAKIAEGIFDSNGREMKQLLKVREAIDAEWENEGVMKTLVQTGVLQPPETKKESKKSSVRPPRTSIPKSNIKRSSPGFSKVDRGTPKAGRFSSPAGSAAKRSEIETPRISDHGSSKKRATSVTRRSLVSTPKYRSESPNRTVDEKPKNKTLASNHSSIRKTRLTNDERSSSEAPSRNPSPAPRRQRLPFCPSTKNAQSTPSPSSLADLTRSVARSTSTKLVDTGSSSSNQENVLQGNNAGVLATPKNETGTKPSPVGSSSHDIAKLAVTFNLDPSSPLVGTPVVNLLARVPPLSPEEVNDNSDILQEIVNMLSNSSTRHEQYLGIQALALFAKDHPKHPSWSEKYTMVIDCLIAQIRQINSTSAVGTKDELSHYTRSPSKKMTPRQEAQHLFLQGIRSLLQFVPYYVDSKVNDIVQCLLECTTSAPFEIVHTAERALINLVTSANPKTCFQCLTPFMTDTKVNLDEEHNPPILLSTIRTMKYLVERVPYETLEGSLPLLLPLFRSTLRHKSVDMRKATVFVLVEMHFVLGSALKLNAFTESQQKLIGVYINSHSKKSAATSKVSP